MGAALSLGFFEMINNPLQSEYEAGLTGSPIKISNPLSADMEYLRTSLLSGALLTGAREFKAGCKGFKTF
ncbi:MAG: hypothetical protein MZV64_04010 [Ignavibacteriales bacterium]|nr:hypothetical protein [Ignavibacteriales bacterium]